ncbi:MAG: NAD+ synthase [Acidiferrobacteraceae bacterium]
MSAAVRVVLAQINLVVGDVEGNADRMLSAAIEARDRLSAQLIVFPELAVTGYPPEDLLFRTDVMARVDNAMKRLASGIRGIDALVGCPLSTAHGTYNAASWVRDGQVVATYRKQVLPNYGVFDEQRYFVSGSSPCVVEMRGVRVGVTICEDIWVPGPARAARDAGARVIVNINASPYHLGKGPERESAVRARVQETGCGVLYANLIGGQDEFLFDGQSFAIGRDGGIRMRAGSFREGLFPVDIDATGEVVAGAVAPVADHDESLYEALVLGVRDYVRKNRFNSVLVGLSGGIDSGVTLALATDALGAERVEAVMMPSPYTSDLSLAVAREEAERLRVAYRVIPIDRLLDDFKQALSGGAVTGPGGIVEENLQARIRGVLLMALSNRGGQLVLTTGNKSETAVGYATLYGDMAGGLAVIKDVSKTRVYRLARFINARARERGDREIIPEEVIRRAPSAELAHGQKDSDSLPPYDVLDPIVEAYVERNMSVDDIVAQGSDRPTVERVLSMMRRSEHKRRQSPPGIRVTSRSFGRDWRYPITCNYPTR